MVFGYGIITTNFVRKEENTMKMSNPELKVVRFGSDDVIATSLFYLAAGQFAGYEGSSPYVEFEGVMRPNGDGTYQITNITHTAGVDQDTVDGVTSGGSIYLPEFGITIPATAMEPIAQQTYDAYAYSEGTYYTHGATYHELYWQ